MHRVLNDVDDRLDELDELVRSRRERFGFYADIYPADVGIERVEDVRTLPSFTKDELIEDRGGVYVAFSDRLADAQYTDYTSGTSGTATVVLRSTADERGEQEKIRTAGYADGIREHLVFHSITIQKSNIWPVLEREDAFYLYADHRDVGMAAEMMTAVEPGCIWTSPTLGVTLSEQVDEQARAGVKRLVMGGEPLSDERREILADRFPNAEMYLFYGLSETGHLGYQCDELAGSNTYHPHTDQILYEVIGPDDGSEGELVVTNMVSDSSAPFTRYRTGDRVRIEEDACGCDEVAMTVLGRIEFDQLKISGLTVYRDHFEDALSTVADLVQQDYQIHLHEDGSDDDVVARMEVHLLPRTEADRSDHVRRQVEAGIMENFTVTANASWADLVEEGRLTPIQVRFVESLGDGPKTKPVVDHRSGE